MRRVLPLKIALASLMIAACVTINVYFPAAAADKAADQFINDVTGGAKGSSPTPPQSNLVPTRTQDPRRERNDQQRQRGQGDDPRKVLHVGQHGS